MKLKIIFFFISILHLTSCMEERNIHLLCTINARVSISDKAIESRYHLNLNYPLWRTGECKTEYNIIDDSWGMNGEGNADIFEQYYICNAIVLEPIIKDTRPTQLFKINRYTGSVELKSGESTYVGSCKKILRKY